MTSCQHPENAQLSGGLSSRTVWCTVCGSFRPPDGDGWCSPQIYTDAIAERHAKRDAPAMATREEVEALYSEMQRLSTSRDAIVEDMMKHVVVLMATLNEVIKS